MTSQRTKQVGSLSEKFGNSRILVGREELICVMISSVYTNW